MSNTQKDFLFHLIKSLSKAEKRNFKLFATRISSKREPKFIRLFNIIDKMDTYREEDILKKSKEIIPSQLPNLKAHLYKQILTSLRQIYINHDVTIQLREQINTAKVLYVKGLYTQSLKILNKAKIGAKKHNRFLLYHEIIEFEKLIESQHVIHSLGQRAKLISDEATAVNQTVENMVYFSNLALRLFGLYLKFGYVKNEKDKLFISEFFNSNMIAFNIEEMSFFEKFYLFQSHIWYYLIQQNFLNCFKFSQRQVDLFHSEPHMIDVQPDLYIKSMHGLLTSLFFTRHYTKFCKTLHILQEFKSNERFKKTLNVSTLVNTYYLTHLINKHFLDGNFADGIKHVPEIEKFLKDYRHHLDNHRVLIFYYKIACLYFGNDEIKNAIVYLNRVINLKDTSLRSDIHCFARILNLISHFELGNHELLEYQIRSTYRFLLKIEDLQEIQQYILKFLRRTTSISRDELLLVFKKCRSDLLKWVEDPFEKRAFLYLDFISWLDAKIQKKPLRIIIKEKAKRENR